MLMIEGNDCTSSAIGENTLLVDEKISWLSRTKTASL